MELELFKSKALACLKLLNETLPIANWKPCFDLEGKFDSSFEDALYEHDMVGSTIVLLECQVDDNIGFYHDVYVVKIAHLELSSDIGDGIPILRIDVHVMLSHEMRDVHWGGELQDLQNKLQVIAFERTNNKLASVIHLRGRASAPATSQIYANTSTPHNTMLGALSCLNK